MANTYTSEVVSVTTTGTNVLVFEGGDNVIVRDVMIYAKGGAATVTVLYDDLTTDDEVAKKSLAAYETWRPFAAPLAMASRHEIKVNTDQTLTVLITYVEIG